MDISSQDIVHPLPPVVSLRQIALTFLYIGAASFSLAALEETRVWMTQKRRWFTDEEYMQGMGLAQILPGAPTVNLSAYLGFRLRRLSGAAAATAAFLTPSLLLILLLSHLYFTYGRMPVVSGLFRGLGALVTGLVFNTVLNLWKTGVNSVYNWLMALAGFAMVFFFKTGIVPILLMSGGAGVMMLMLGRRSSDNEPGCRRLFQAADWQKTLWLMSGLLGILGSDWLLIQIKPELAALGSNFLRIGALVFGSGYAMLPFIQNIVIQRFGWLTNPEFAAGLALSLVTPGPVTIIGAFVGYKVAGVIGAVTGLFNMYFPAWAMTVLVATPYARAGRTEPVRRVISGIVAGFIGTLVVVLLKLSMNTLSDIPTIGMAVGAIVIQRFFRVNTLWIVLGGAIISLVAFR